MTAGNGKMKHLGANLQLAQTVNMDKVNLPAYAEIKYDGVRCLMIGNKFYTRAGKQIHLPELSSKYDIGNRMLDMEVMINEGRMIDRQVVSGMINSAIHGKDINEGALNFCVFDTMSAHEYYDKKLTSDTYEDRCRLRTNTLVDYNLHSQFFVPDVTEVDNTIALVTLYDEVRADGYEGLVVKQPKSRYVHKRTKEWARFKDTKTADLICIDYTEGEGKYTGAIGALKLAGVIDGKHVDVKVGSGLSDYDRSVDPQEYIGKTIEVKYNSITTNKVDDGYSLFLPRFVAVRIDK